MRPKNRFISSLNTLLPFLLIFTLMLAILTAGALSLLRSAFGSFAIAGTRTIVINAIEDDLNFYLNEILVNEAYLIYAQEYGTVEEKAAKTIAESQNKIGQKIEELEASGYLNPEEYEDKTWLLLQSFQLQLALHQSAFAQTLAAYTAGDFRAGEQLYAQNKLASQSMRNSLDEAVTVLERERALAAQKFPAELAVAVQVLVVGIIASALLTLWGYKTINGLSQPLLDLRNAITAIGGDIYRHEMLQRTAQRSDQLGALAKDIHHLAANIRQRDADLNQQNSMLKQQLYESRRQRLKLFQPTAKGDRS